MSLISRLFQALSSWRRPRVGPKSSRRVRVDLEHLGDRQLLSVNFTGNVATDFPANKQPGVVVFPDNPSVQHPIIPANLKPLIKVSGFDINGIRATYDATDDTLNIGLEQPLSQMPDRPGPVIAGDADNNGNVGTVSPEVLAVAPGFQEFPDLQGPEQMGAFLDLSGSGKADIVAGFAPQVAGASKPYQVAQAIVNGTGVAPRFGTALPQFTGNVYLLNSPAHPNLEFNVAHFSQLYQQVTGKALTADTQIGIGAFGGSTQDLRVSDAYFPEQTFRVGDATPPPPPVCPVCPPPPPPPPAEPPITINPHQHRHVNTAHPTDVRVSIFGSVGFDVKQIVPQSVTLGGAHPIFFFDRYINHDGFLDATFVFRGSDIKLPRGITDATVTGTTVSGRTFSSTFQIFNRDSSYYSPAQLDAQARRQAAKGANGQVTPMQRRLDRLAAHDHAIAEQSVTDPALSGPVVSIPMRAPASAHLSSPVVVLPQQAADKPAATVQAQRIGPVVSIPMRNKKSGAVSLKARHSPGYASLAG